MLKPLLVLGALGVLTSTAPAATITGNMNFLGKIDSSCEIRVDKDGKLASHLGFTVLSSEVGIGERGSALITTTDPAFKASVSTPTAFLEAPATGNDNVTFATQYQLSGETTSADVAGATETPLNTGASTISVGLVATKSSGSFVRGDYRAEVIVTCE